MRLKSTIMIALALGLVAVVACVLLFLTFAPQLDSGPSFNIDRAKARIKAIQTATDMFRIREHRYPTTSEGIQALVPTFLPSVPMDPWNNPFIYRSNGSGLPNIYSAGPNGRDEGGMGDDIVVANY